MKDEDIIRLILKGDCEQFSQLIDRYSSKVYSTAYSYTHNHEEARDLVQDILIKVYNSLHSFKAEAKFSTWLYRIAVNCCIDWNRKSQNRSVKIAWSNEEDDVLDRVIDSEGSPEQIIIKQEHKEMIQEVVSSLPEIYKTVLILYYFEELQIQEICKVLDCPKRTVETRLYRAKGILKNMLNQVLEGGALYELRSI